MQHTSQSNQSQENELDLNVIINRLLNKKKLVIIITVIVTLLSAIFAFTREEVYNSSILFEIQDYDFNRNIENSDSLISALNINFVYKMKSKLSFSKLEDTLINIHSSRHNSKKSAEDEINLATTFITKRYQTIVNNKISSLNQDIDSINLKSKAINQEINFIQEIWKSKIAEDIISVKSNIQAIEKKIKSLKMIIIEETENMRLLESKPDLTSQFPSIFKELREVIHGYENSIVDYEIEKSNMEAKLSVFQENISFISNNSNHILLTTKMKDSDRLLSLSSRLVELNEKRNNKQSDLIHLNNWLNEISKIPSKNSMFGEIFSSKSKDNSVSIIIIGFILGMGLSVLVALFALERNKQN